MTKQIEIVKEKAELTPTAEALISQAINKNVPVDVLERLLAFAKEIKAIKAKEEYDYAMAEFQSECPTIKKTKEVKTKSGIVAYRYTPIESIVEQVKDVLKKHGFSYSTKMELLADGVKVVCKVTHSSGHSEESPMQVPLGNKTDIMSQTQVVAAAQTFAKRYAFCNAFGILTGDEDTDAQVEKMGVNVKLKEEGEGPKTLSHKQSRINNYEKAKDVIQKEKNSSKLMDWGDKIRESQKYTDEERNDLLALISLRIDVIENQ